MKEAFAAMLGSKKMLTGVIASVTSFLLVTAGKYGVVLDQESALLLVKIVLALSAAVILGQGAADFGKEKAKIDAVLAEQAKQVPPADSAQEAPKAQ